MLKCEVMLSYEDPRAAWTPGLDAYEQGKVLRGRKFYAKTVESAKKKAFVIIRKSQLLKKLITRRKIIEWCCLGINKNSFACVIAEYEFELNSKFLNPQAISDLKIKDARRIDEIEFWVKKV